MARSCQLLRFALLALACMATMAGAQPDMLDKSYSAASEPDWTPEVVLAQSAASSWVKNMRITLRSAEKMLKASSTLNNTACLGIVSG